MKFCGSFFQYCARRHRMAHRLLPWATLLFASLSCGCAVPLGPGFMLRSRQIALAGAPAASSPIHVRVTEQMKNDGNRPLQYLDVKLPSAAASDQGHLRIQVDGKDVAAVPRGTDANPEVRVRFEPPWPVRQQRKIGVEYDLSTDAGEGVAGVTPQGFYFADPRALPFWATPPGFFARGGGLHRDESFAFTLPADFRLMASGRQEKRSRTPDHRVSYRFRTSGEHLPSFVIAGRYRQQAFPTRYGEIDFWTFDALDSATAQMAADRLAASASAFVKVFGPLPLAWPLYIVEAPAGLLPSDASGQNASAAAFPEGLLLGPAAFEQGLASEPVLRTAEEELVRIWFGWRVPLRAEASTLLGRGLRLYAIALAAEARGGEAARRQEIVRLLEEYDRVSAPGETELLLQPPPQSTRRELDADARKAALFLADLDDLAGQDRFERSLLEVQQAIAGRGLSVSLDDVRSALEANTGMAMADEFRLWLNHPGIPADFRARYSDGTAPTQPSPDRPAIASISRR
jgi:hypothetical protein